jgi:tRNA dimethylallyltransferase
VTAGPIAFLTGPTAVGKSTIALVWAFRRGLELISLDSRQVYRGLDIGTAKPSREEQSRVRHHLVDILDPHETCSAGRYSALYRSVLSDLESRTVRGLAVGGTGFYWEACSRGLHAVPAAYPENRARLETLYREERASGLAARLRALDPAGASRVAPRNWQRVMRAIELIEATGRPLAEIFAGERRMGVSAPVVVLLRSRSETYARIEARCRAMLDAGLLGEIEQLLASGVPADAPAFRTVGYREFLPHLLAGAPLGPCITRFVQSSRQYAKRQETWFRHRIPERIEIALEGETPPEENVDRIERALGVPQGDA